MKNVPWHEDVKAFAEALIAEAGRIYGLACEHAHSCCVLLANESKFKVGGRWHTWIDYETFDDLVCAPYILSCTFSFVDAFTLDVIVLLLTVTDRCFLSRQVSSGAPFSSEDYMAPTPDWAVYGAAEGGFDPKEMRVKKERRHGTGADAGGCT